MEKNEQKGVIAWFAGNHVAANLLMFIIIAAGAVSAMNIQKRTLPDFDINNVQVRVPYLGAAPQEVEEGVVIKVEEAVQDIDGIEDIRSVSAEGFGTVTIEVREDQDIDEILTIPRGSKEEDQIRAHVVSIAERNGLEHHVDGVGNVVVKVRAIAGIASCSPMASSW